MQFSTDERHAATGAACGDIIHPADTRNQQRPDEGRAGSDPLTRLTVGYTGTNHFGGSFDVARRFGDGAFGARVNGAFRTGDDDFVKACGAERITAHHDLPTALSLLDGVAAARAAV